jgi:hypothetical protein
LSNLRQQVAAEQSSGAGGDSVGDGTGSAGDGGDTGTGGGDSTGTTGDGNGTTGDGTGSGTGPGTSAPPPPPPMLSQAGPPPLANDYRWSLGFELFGMSNISVGDNVAGDVDEYSDSGFHMRFTGNMILNAARRLGGQTYIGYSNIQSTFSGEALSLFDLGVGGFWHLPLARQLYLTPQVGAHLSLQGPVEDSQVFIAAGARIGASLDWALGNQGMHVLSVSTALNMYTRAGGESNGYLPEDYGLDTGGLTAVFGIGYTLRFSTPLGQFPIINLE